MPYNPAQFNFTDHSHWIVAICIPFLILKEVFKPKELSEREQVYKRLKKQAKKELKRIWKMK